VRTKLRHAIQTVLAAAALLAAIAAGQPAKTLEGDWRGTLETGAAKLRLLLKVSKAADGKLAGAIDSLDQGATGLPVTSSPSPATTSRSSSPASARPAKAR